MCPSQTDTGVCAASASVGTAAQSKPVASSPIDTTLTDKGYLLNAQEAGNSALFVTTNKALATV